MKGKFATLFLLAGMLTTVPVAAQQGNYSGFTYPHPDALSGSKFLCELLAILNETRSPDAFLVTLSILQEMKPEPREVVPVILRNAERLRLFKRTDPDKGTEQQRMIVECIAELMKNDPDFTAKVGQRPCASPVSIAPEPLNLPEPAEESEAAEDVQPAAATKGPQALSEQDVLRVIGNYLELQCLGRGKPHAGEACVGRVKSSAIVK